MINKKHFINSISSQCTHIAVSLKKVICITRPFFQFTVNFGRMQFEIEKFPGFLKIIPLDMSRSLPHIGWDGYVCWGNGIWIPNKKRTDGNQYIDAFDGLMNFVDTSLICAVTWYQCPVTCCQCMETNRKNVREFHLPTRAVTKCKKCLGFYCAACKPNHTCLHNCL